MTAAAFVTPAPLPCGRRTVFTVHRSPLRRLRGRPVCKRARVQPRFAPCACAVDPQNGDGSQKNADADEHEKDDNKLWNALKLVLAALRAALAPGGFVWGVAAGAALAAAFLLLPDSRVDQALREKVAIFDFILQDISSSYVERVDLDKLFETGVNSMLGTLDPYTQFENNADALEMSLRSSGRYAGVGLGISAAEVDPITEDGTNRNADEMRSRPARRITVVSAFEGYAFDAGVRPGDVIESIDDRPLDGLSLEQVTDLLRGESGTSVSVRVRREGRPSPLSFVLQRRDVHIRDVPLYTLIGNPEAGVGYLRLQSFAKEAAAEVRSAIDQLIADAEAASPGRGLCGLVVDLRGNPGGLLNAAVEVSESLVPRDSVIVSTRGRGMSVGPTYLSTRDPALPSGTRLAVLVNGQTASASEIVAGAVQDLDLGVVVGSRTFGKGLVQNVQELPYRTALKYTVGKYYTPSGRCIQSLDYRQGGVRSTEVARSSERGGEQGTPTGSRSPAAGRLRVGEQYEAHEIAESNRKEFRTASGRRVRDGGGIEPDVTVTRRPSFLEVALGRQNMFFKYANRYAALRALDVLPDAFSVSDSEFREFVDFVARSRFRYESQFDIAFDELDAMLESVGYDGARGRVADLRRATEHEMREDFVRHEPQLRAQLESAIRFRLQPDSSRIKAELRNDDVLAEAVRVLRDAREYNEYLEPVHVTQAVADADQSDRGEVKG